MSAVPPTLAEWLRSAELIEVAGSTAVTAAWGDLAAVSRISTPLAIRSDAAVEGQRQLAFLGVPMALETLELPGRQAALLGTSKRIACDAPGYEATPAVFVIGVQENDNGSTQLTVLRRVFAA